jgi:signal peptidase II
VVAGVVAVDQIAKAIAISSLGRGASENVFLGIDLTHVRNTGIAFGALEDGGGAIVALVGVAVALLLVYFARHVATPLLWLPVGAIVGGAVGNLADRARDGTVIDFIDPIAWPAFNLADVAVVAGVLGLLYVMDGRPRDRGASSPPAR